MTTAYKARARVNYGNSRDEILRDLGDGGLAGRRPSGSPGSSGSWRGRARPGARCPFGSVSAASRAERATCGSGTGPAGAGQPAERVRTWPSGCSAGRRACLRVPGRHGVFSSAEARDAAVRLGSGRSAGASCTIASRPLSRRFCPTDLDLRSGPRSSVPVPQTRWLLKPRCMFAAVRSLRAS